MMFKGIKLRVLLLLVGILCSALLFQFMVIDSSTIVENFGRKGRKKKKKFPPIETEYPPPVTVEDAAVKESLRKMLTNCIQ